MPGRRNAGVTVTAMRRGFTLVETLLVIAIMAIVTAAAGPRLGSLLDRQRVSAAASAIVDAHTRARIRAVLESRVTLLDVRADSIILSVSVPGGSTPVWSAPGPATHGVTLTAPSRSVTFAPTGIAMGVSNVTFTLTRGTATKRVVVSRLGRVRVQ